MEYKTKKWHDKCFQCVVCKTQVGSKPFIIPNETDVYCVGCFEEKFATKCTKCKKIMTTGGVTFKNEVRSYFWYDLSAVAVSFLCTRRGTGNASCAQTARRYWLDKSLHRDRTSLTVPIALGNFSPNVVRPAANPLPALVERDLSLLRAVIGTRNVLFVQCARSQWPAKDSSLMVIASL